MSSSTVKFDTSFIPDVSTGPLDEFREKSNFEWKKLRVYFEGVDFLRAKYEIWEKLATDPLFAKSSVTPSSDDQKRIAALRMKRVAELALLPDEIKNSSYEKRVRLSEACSNIAYNQIFIFQLKFMMSQNEAFHAICMSLSVKMALGIGLFCNALIALGSERHRRIYNQAMNGEVKNLINSK